MQLGIAPLRPRLALGEGALEILQAELQLILGQAFGPGAELHALQLQQQVMQALVVRQQGVALRSERITLCHDMVAFGDGAVTFRQRRQQERTQGGSSFGQGWHRIGRSHHGAESMRPPSA